MEAFWYATIYTLLDVKVIREMADFDHLAHYWSNFAVLADFCVNVRLVCIHAENPI